MPKIDRPFAPQQPGAGTDNYIDGGPTRAGLEELRGKVNAAPTTWATVAEAEAVSYTEPESVVVTETGRTYTYSASSGATRDGIRVLTPAGGGRLLATKTGSDEVEIPKIGTPGHQSLTQSLQVGLSTGACNGNFVTDAGSGAINIAAGEGMIRAVNSSDSAIFAFSWPEVNGVAIPLNSVRYVGVEYNGGSPQAVVRTSSNWNGQTEFQAATVVNEGGSLHILNNPQETCDGVQKIFHRLIETQPFQFAERLGGGRFSEVGTRNLSLSPCEFYDGLNEFPITIKNTSTGDTFDAYYGNFTKIAAQTQWDNQNYDNAGTLTALSANRYGVHWLYIEMDDSFALIYGKGNYNTISDAEAALPPASLPLRLSLGSRLAAKLIFQKGAASAIQIESAFDVNFKSGMPVSHSDLINVPGNGTYHLSESERDAAIRIASPSQSGLMSAAMVAAADAKNLSYEGKRVDIVSPYIAKTNVYKGQLHIHTTNSDGAQSPAVVATAYRDAGYHFLNFSDHNYVTTDPGVSGILSISGDEETQSTGHILRVKATTDSSSSNHQAILNHAESESSFSVMAHPNWPGATWTDVELEGLYKYQAIEIWNNAISPNESAESNYDALLTKYRKLFLIASDDSHDVNAAYSKKTAVRVFSNNLTENEIIDSLKRGNYYSTYTPSGTEVNLSLSVSGYVINASVEVSSTIEFIIKGGVVKASSVGTSAAYTVVGDEVYVRVRVTNGSAQAWSNPVFVNQQYDAYFQKGGLVDGNLYTTGNIGAGTTNPQEKIDVAGNVRLTTSTPQIKSVGGSSFAANTVFRPYSEDTNGRIVVAPSGSASESNVIVQTNSNVDATGSKWLGIGGGFGGAISGTFTIGSMSYAQTTANSLPIAFAVSNSSGRVEAARIDYTGNVGIGNSSPVARLDAKGSTADNTASVVIFADSAGTVKLSVRNDGQLKTSGSRIIDCQTLTTDTTLTQSSQSCVACNPSDTGMVLTMHLSPPDGIRQTTVNASAYAVTLGRNGQKMAGSEANYTLPANTSITWQFFGATIGWLIISNG